MKKNCSGSKRNLPTRKKTVEIFKFPKESRTFLKLKNICEFGESNFKFFEINPKILENKLRKCKTQTPNLKRKHQEEKTTLHCVKMF